HVRPGKNPDGTQSDNIILRVMSHADWHAREESDDLDCHFLLDREQVGEANYKFKLGDVMGDPDAPHPPGTHWYHPHSHGATHNQVSSGMAGFLIVEGDVDDAINEVMTGETDPDPQIKTGDWDYRERLVLMQRVSVNPSTDKDAPPGESDLKTPDSPNIPAVNGSNQPKTIIMRPGAVERWRVLNGSVDGRGYKRFMVLEGEFATDNDLLRRRDPTSGELLPVTPGEIAAAKQRLYQLSMDGVTLVSPDGRYVIKDLAEQNPDAEQLSPADEETAGAALAALQACFVDSQSVLDCYVRPNEVYMAPGNRTDLFFQAPRDGGGKIFTILAKAVVVHGDNYQAGLQSGKLPPPPGDIVVAYVHVPDDDPAPPFDVLSLMDVLPDAPPYLLPITEEELRVSDDEVAAREDVSAGDLRTRTLSYSGWGAADFPLTYANPAFVEAHPELLHLTYAPYDGPGDVHYLLAPQTRTMAINARFDLSSGEAPPPPRKFDPTDPDMAQMLVDTAEEWAVYNNSIALWGDTANTPPGVQTKANKAGYPMTRAEGQALNAENPDFQIVSKSIDHPFHIHINPFYLLRIEVPDENGNLVNILPEPRWGDVVWLPRNGGRVLFRSRFADFIGQYVHHCHILLHEDNGMMHVVQTTQYAADANYVPKSGVPAIGATEEEVNAVYPRPSLALSYMQSISFVDPNPETGQTFPGFDVSVPEYDDGT
ncbi:MAG: multicopper oxidase domain-containing protein, partial [Candidatus Promineifilaceae bacterium]